MINNKDSIPRIIDELRDRPKANGLLEMLISLVADSLADSLERSYCELKKECDELKAKLEDANQQIKDLNKVTAGDFDSFCEKCDTYKENFELSKNIAAAERCIDEIMNELSKAVAGDSIRNVNKAKKIINAYRKKKEGEK